MTLLVTHPKVALRSCEHCQAFVYDEATGKPAAWRGAPLPRGKTPPPCRTSAGCAKGTPEDDRGLSVDNQRALAFHRRCDAVGQWPDDPIVRANAAEIAAAERRGDAQLRERDRARRERDGTTAKP